MIELFQMWALVEVLGLVSLPLAFTICANLPDRGWAFSKALGMVVLAFLVWLPLMLLRFLSFHQLFIAGIALLFLVGNLAIFLRVRHTFVKMLRLNRGYIVATELVFLGMVFLLGWLRSYGPDIRSFEMFMDEGFIAAIMRSTHFPPNDMWFAGQPINYYYYAHYVLAMLAKLLGQSPSIAFNTGICIFFGLTAVNLFGVTCNIVAWARHLRSSRQTPLAPLHPRDAHPPLLGSIPYGIASMIMALILGNLAATQEWWQSHHGLWAQYDWFTKPTRIIENTINEFPAFSFLLSCFHAHVLALAFTILAIGLAFNLFLEPEARGLSVFGRGWRLVLTLNIMALVLGGLFTMNGWDYPTYMGLTLVCIIIQQWLAHNGRFSSTFWRDVLLICISLIALSFIWYLPFHLNFISPAQGIGLVAPEQRSPLQSELLIYGLFAFIFLSLLLVSAIRTPRWPLATLLEYGEKDDEKIYRRQVKLGSIAVALFLLLSLAALFLLPNSGTLVVTLNIAILGVLLFFYHLGDRTHAFSVLLGSIAFALIAVCEIVFLKDVFAENYPRMNTVFKFYFQSWALLSIASGAGLFFILESFRPVGISSFNRRLLQRGIGVVWIACLLLLVVASSAYPLAAPGARYARYDDKGNPYLTRTNNLDGLAYLQSDPASPGDYDAIRWLNANIEGAPVIVEAIGDDYTGYARVSSFTGLPTIMGWIGHELQWRINWLRNETNEADFYRRIGDSQGAGDVELIYTSTDPAQVLAIMARYQAQYIYVGPLEYAKYSMKADLQRYRAFMQVVYDAGGVTIYKIKET